MSANKAMLTASALEYFILQLSFCFYSSVLKMKHKTWTSTAS
jgi:hypothetical protein